MSAFKSQYVVSGLGYRWKNDHSGMESRKMRENCVHLQKYYIQK